MMDFLGWLMVSVELVSNSLEFEGIKVRGWFARLTFNYGEFAIIKTGVENGFPDAKELDRVAVSQPIRDKELAVLRLEHVRERDVVAILAREDGHSRSVDFDDGFFGLAHG